MRKFILIIFGILAGLILLIFLYLNYDTYFSKGAKKGKRNIENIKKIEIGMNISFIDSIMGEPDTIILPDPIRYPYTQYLYYTNDDSYSSVDIVFDSTLTVKETYYPRN